MKEEYEAIDEIGDCVYFKIRTLLEFVYDSHYLEIETILSLDKKNGKVITYIPHNLSGGSSAIAVSISVHEIERIIENLKKHLEKVKRAKEELRRSLHD